ncbi:MaoC/PaaZ C-terminal domain-containing protein [Lentzea cavernae]|uniref:MaoC family dehydratase n=1 Tax=Lentzea cavernae TaxID=2020703 RepID=A0ABQ3MA26_9PSEU|nr:MaoC/PaaZ C-terminal domain-containing protein [Lentzea cavernae]GHH37537.1 MaoC family dehydratase [Lentzea cavernae]
MSAAVSTEVGTELPALSVRLKRDDLVRYAGASLDFNPIHWNERTAREVGLPDVIAHGMLTMAVASRIVAEWIGDPGAIVEYGCRFGRPVVVPDDGEGALVEVTAKVTKAFDDGTVKVNINAAFDGKSVLTGAFARVRVS